VSGGVGFYADEQVDRYSGKELAAEGITGKGFAPAGSQHAAVVGCTGGSGGASRLPGDVQEADLFVGGGSVVSASDRLTPTTFEPGMNVGTAAPAALMTTLSPALHASPAEGQSGQFISSEPQATSGLSSSCRGRETAGFSSATAADGVTSAALVALPALDDNGMSGRRAGLEAAAVGSEQQVPLQSTSRVGEPGDLFVGQGVSQVGPVLTSTEAPAGAYEVDEGSDTVSTPTKKRKASIACVKRVLS